MRRQTNSALQETEEAGETVPPIRLILDPHGKLLVTGKLVFIWRGHRRVRAPDDEAGNCGVVLKHRIPSLAQLTESGRGDRKDIDLPRADGGAPQDAVFAHLNMQQTTRAVRDKLRQRRDNARRGKRNVQRQKIAKVARGKVLGRLVQEGDDTEGLPCVRRAGMWLGVIKAKHITWGGQP